MLEDALSDLDELGPGVLGSRAQDREGFGLFDLLVGHDGALGAFDHLAIRERLPQRIDLAGEFFELLESRPCDDDGRLEIDRVDGLDEVGHDMVGHGLLHEAQRTLLGDDDRRHRLLGSQLDGGFDSVAVGKFDAGHDQLGPLFGGRLEHRLDRVAPAQDGVPASDDGRELLDHLASTVGDDDGEPMQGLCGSFDGRVLSVGLVGVHRGLHLSGPAGQSTTDQCTRRPLERARSTPAE